MLIASLLALPALLPATPLGLAGGEAVLERAAVVESTRIVIRAAPLTDNGIPGAFDSTSLPEKVVTLKRQLPIENPIVFALTR